MTTAEAAIEYRQRGLSIIPISPQTKKPLVRWKPYQLAPADGATISTWFTTWPDANVGIITGAVSGLIALDGDGVEGVQSLRSLGTTAFTPLVRTPRGGLHQFFKHPGGRISTRAGILLSLDVRADGGYVVAPPSLRADGTGWTWLTTFGDFAPAELPGAVLAMLLETQARDKKTAGPIPEGERNTTLYLLGRSYVTKGIDAEDIRDALLAENVDRCVPPLSEAEVRAIAAHVVTQERRADFTPPDAAAVEVRAYAQKLRRRADTWRWPVQIATLARTILEAHLISMERAGRYAYAASLRELAERSGLSKSAVERAQRFLCAEGWLTLQKGAPRGVREAPVWRVHVPKASRLTVVAMLRQSGTGTRLRLNGSGNWTPLLLTAQSVPISIVLIDLLADRECPDLLSPSRAFVERECPEPLSHDVWCRRWRDAKGLGASCGRIYGSLHSTVPVPVRWLVNRLEVSGSSVHRLLAHLEAHGLALRTDGGWLRGPADLAAVAIELGVAGRSEAVRDEHRRQRERFDEALADGLRSRGARGAFREEVPYEPRDPR